MNYYEKLESKRKNQKLINTYMEDHRYEMGYQLYGEFIRKDIKGFLDKLLNENELGSLKGKFLILPSNPLVDSFIQNFVVKYNLGFVSYRPRKYVDDEAMPKTIVIEFMESTFIDTLIYAYVMEMQELMYFDLSPEEAQQELKDFQENNATFLENKKEIRRKKLKRQ